ncbi:MAG: hemin uptake protein HemP [Chromatiales bacterium]|nr:hemin uptake protein HemP [Chromatiales bacterium]MDX9766040.1 hemin uptake protein HemP [Ectothiorhodospiraceae bacterium]
MTSTKIEDGRPALTVSRPAPRPAAAAAVLTVRSAELMGGARQLHIEHAGEVYVLRQTSKGKLILTK